MSNPFKVGDKIVRLPAFCTSSFSGRDGFVFTVAGVRPGGYSSVRLEDGPNVIGFDGWWDQSRFRAAIAGLDYPIDPPAQRPVAYEGHLPDGSGIQAHSAGGLYPFVLVWRDKRNGPDTHGKYDVGVIGPTNQDPIWCPCSDHAIRLAETIKECKL